MSATNGTGASHEHDSIDHLEIVGGPPVDDETGTEAWVVEPELDEAHSNLTPMAAVYAARDIAHAAHQGNVTARRAALALVLVFVVPALFGLLWFVYSAVTFEF